MDTLIQQIVSGLATGGIYGSVALALVMIYQATDVVNYAQGEMAMFSTYLAWTLLNAGLPYWVAFVATLAIAFVGGAAARAHPDPSRRERAGADDRHRLHRPARHPQQHGRLDLLLHPEAVPQPVPAKPIQVGNIYFGAHDLGALGVTLVVLAAAVRCSSASPRWGWPCGRPPRTRCRAAWCGIRVGWMLALGWGLAAMVGAVAGMMVAPIVFLDPNMMAGILIYAFASATLGGFTSPGGAVLGGLIVGVIENLVGTYVKFIGTELKLTVALALILVVLVVRPSGLFGRAAVHRV